MVSITTSTTSTYHNHACRGWSLRPLGALLWPLVLCLARLGTHLTFHTHKTHPRHTLSLTWYSQRHQKLPVSFILTTSALVAVLAVPKRKKEPCCYSGPRRRQCNCRCPPASGVALLCVGRVCIVPPCSAKSNYIVFFVRCFEV